MMKQAGREVRQHRPDPEQSKRSRKDVSMNMEQISPTINLPATVQGHSGQLTMGTRDIADLTGKQHKHVTRDTKALLEQLQIDPQGYAQTWTDPQNGQSYLEYRLPKDLTITLITGYRADLRYKVVKRLEQLEEQQAPAAIDVRNPGQLALIASQLIEVNQEQAKQIEAMQDTVQAHDRLTAAEGSLCITDTAKTLGIRRKDMFDWLHDKGWIFKREGSDDWLAYAPRLASGVMEHRVVTYTRSDGTESVRTQARITPKGLSALAKLIQPTAKLIGGAA